MRQILWWLVQEMLRCVQPFQQVKMERMSLYLKRHLRLKKAETAPITHGSIRFAYNGVEDLKEIMPDLSQEDIDSSDFGVYSEEQFYDDMCRVTDTD